MRHDDNVPLIIKMLKLFLGCDLGKPEDRHRKSKSQKAPHAWTDGDAGQMSQGEALNQKTSLWKKMVARRCERMTLQWATVRLKTEAEE